MGFDLRFTDKEVTAWGGMGLMKRLLDHMDFDSALQVAGLPQPVSNRGYRPEQLIRHFMLSIWCGANRFEHSEVTRHDPVLKRLFGFKQMANFKAIMRLFRKFSQADNERIVTHHPLMAFVSDTRMIANCWLGPRNTASANIAGPSVLLYVRTH